jgi:YD repeat-containing protein
VRVRGRDVVTTRDERGRQKKLYHDVLGRMSKVEELNYDSTVYSTGVYAYDTLDRLTNIRQYQGAATSGVYQERLFHYDGHGRPDSRTTPEQGTTTYSYNPDDTLSVRTDARGATLTYGYTARHLTGSITFGAPAGVAATPNVGFSYDAAGNRTQMTDGLGSTAYTYDNMSRMTQESRTFTGVGTYYHVGRLLNSYTGTEAKAHTGRSGGVWGVHDGPYSQAYIKDVWGNVTQKMGRAGDPDQFTATYTNNRRDGFTYDASGNLTFDGGQPFTYDATGQPSPRAASAE